MERRSRVLLLALLPLGLMCSAFNEQVLSEACDRYKDVPAGDPGDFEGCQTEQAVAKKFVEGVRQKLPASLVANCINQAESSSTGWAGAAYCLKNALKRADEIQKCMKVGEKPTIGMTYEQAVATCWGKPETINRTTREGHVEDQAIYADHRRYLNFNDGILTSIQESGAAP
jgi:hypothetical protein